MTNEETLNQMMSLVALRDRSAFERLYKASSAHLFWVAMRILRNEGEADEILQEAFVKIWHSADTYRQDAGTPMTWMINVVRNKSIDLLRSRSTERSSTSSLDPEGADVAGGGDDSPHRLLEESFEKARIDGCMGGLAATQRQALALAYYRGMTHAEIAGALRAPLGTVKGWVRRGLDQLKACLEAAGVRSA